MANFINNPSQQNYYFKKSVAYTEDHILVKKLFLYNVPAEEVQTYFEGFGRVLRLQLFARQSLAANRKLMPRDGGGGCGDGGSRRTKTGYVYFANPRDAAKALRKNLHTINGRRLSVQANDSWHQPDAYGLARPTAEQSSPAAGDELSSSSSSSPSSSPSMPSADILNLNDHCLEHIMRLLSLPDRIHFARTCSRFRSVYQQVSPALNRCISFDVFDAMTVWDMRDFFMLSGRHLHHIEGIIPPGRCQRLCEFFGQHCINLRTMHVTASKLSVRNMHKIFARLDRLEELQLRACALGNSSLLALKHLLQLKRLDLSDNHQLTGLNMNYLPASIVYLSLTSCNGLQSKYLPKLCKALPQLRELNLKAVYTITTGFQQVVSGKCCSALEELTISSGPANEYEHIAKLPGLKKLVLYSYEQGTTLRPELLTWLVEHKSEQLLHFEARGQNSINAEMLAQIGQLSALRTLSLPHNNAIGDRELEALRLQQLEQISLKYWPNLGNNAVLRLLMACPKLQELHLEECPRLTEKLLHDIIFKLRMQIRDKENRRQLPIRMHVYGSKINEFSLQHADVAAKDIIDACLAPPSSSDLCLVRMSNLLEFDFYSDDYDSFGSDDELDPDYDRYMVNEGFLSDEEYDYHDMVFNDDDLFVINMENVAELFNNWNANANRNANANANANRNANGNGNV
ncbi:uncharacterized protein LOC115759075 isoform X2 [Drosophila novamexicana]|uniref:uncharacterized protein LOC115759075 isoform X2 n=1 Tax=Drosophila novamexicana TaxID=47314 RepID=UPI0011E5A252|nr:uncharacterized protein LOC115759075 isoform X2 [Drosophila novamexicana]